MGKHHFNRVIKALNKKLALAVALALLMMAGVTPTLLAHATLIRSEPANNAILADPPKEVRLWFSESISPEFSSAQIFDVNGQSIKPTHIRVDSADPTLMIVSLPALEPGLYSLRWKVLSETDGHITQGPLIFGVGEGVNMESAVTTQPEVNLPLPEILLRWLNYGLFMAVVGAVAVMAVVLNPAIGSARLTALRLAARQRVLSLLRWGVSAAGLVGFGLLIWQISTVLETLPENAAILGVSWQVLAHTRWGLLWLIRQTVILAVAGIIFWLDRQKQTDNRWPIPVVGGLLLLWGGTQALTGHAAALTPNTTLAVVADLLHLLAAGMWVGGLLALIIGLLPLIRRQKSDLVVLIRAGWKPFSGLAAVSVALLFATGLYATGRQVASPDAMLTTLYGQALLGKIGLVLAVGAIGLLNAFLLHPRLRNFWPAARLARWLRLSLGLSSLSLHHLPRLVLLEAGLGVLVVLVTGLITALPQALGPEFEVNPAEIPTALSQTIDDVVVTFSASPNRPGQNLFTVRAVSTRRPPPAEIMRVIMRVTYQDQDIGQLSADATEIEPGLYQLGGSQFSLAGPYQVEVVVRRRGVEDQVAHFSWMVAPPGETRPVVVSNRSLEPGLTLVAALLLLGLLGVTGWVWWRRNRWKRAFVEHNLAERETVDEIDKLLPKDRRFYGGAAGAGRLWKRRIPARKYEL